MKFTLRDQQLEVKKTSIRKIVKLKWNYCDILKEYFKTLSTQIENLRITLE